MKILLALFFLSPLQALEIRANSTSELKQKIVQLFTDLRHTTYHYPGAVHKIHLLPAQYTIHEDDLFFSNFASGLNYETFWRSLNPRVEIWAWLTSTKSILLHEGSFGYALYWLEQTLRNHLTICQEIRYQVTQEKNFLKALALARKNRTDTTIKLDFCNKPPCIRDQDLARKIRKLEMRESDGMRLRLESRFFSLEKDKAEYFASDFEPFLEHGQ